MPVATVAARLFTLPSIHPRFTSRWTSSIHMMTRFHVFAVSTGLFTFRSKRCIPTFYKKQISLRRTHALAFAIFDRYVKHYSIFCILMCNSDLYFFSFLILINLSFSFCPCFTNVFQRKSAFMSHVYVVLINKR